MSNVSAGKKRQGVMHLGYITTVRILTQLTAAGQVHCTITQRERKHCYYLGS